jgi:hypothetical protein
VRDYPAAVGVRFDRTLDHRQRNPADVPGVILDRAGPVLWLVLRGGNSPTWPHSQRVLSEGGA